MFTGIIEDIGIVKLLEKKGASGRISVGCSFKKADDLKIGFSIAVDGVCLTVTDFKGGLFSSDISAETLELTTLRELKEGKRVNLERPLTLSKPLGGHIVTGHIDCVGTILDRMKEGDNAVFEISLPNEFLDLIVYKGSVAVNGISLTIKELTERGFRVQIIPHTLKLTTLSEKAAGQKVNIETDIIGKYVKRILLSCRKGGITEGLLAEHGFIKKG